MNRSDGVGNSPFAIVGVLLLVLGTVGMIALAGRAVRPVVGTPMTVAGAARSASPAPSVVTAVPAEPSAPVRPAAGLGSDPLLTGDVALPSVACDLPTLDAGDGLRDFYSAALVCLDDAWQPPLEHVGAEFVPAGLDLAPDPGSGCGATPGEEEATAYYCSADEVIYMPTERLLTYVGLYPSALLSVLAHEYGHHVQNLSGTLEAVATRLVGVESGSAAELDATRRIELQANCFAGLFLASAAGRGSVTRDEAVAAVNDFANSADSDTHGTVENQTRWARAGFEADSVAACDTWSAPASAVA